ncbi:hypothetical protein A2Y99_03905, partial [Candidatus Gottesmanbacteria bacterium RBG_13_37_7]
CKKVMKKSIFLLLLIIVLSVFLRFFYLERIPNGLYSDEAAFGYNAYSLLKTGKDEFGFSYPLVLKSFGDFKAAFYSYYLIPFVWILDLSVISIRTGTAMLGIGTVILVYLLIKELSKSNRIALISSLLLAVSPFALQFNRMVHENNLVVFLITAGTYLFIVSLRSRKLLILSLICFAASLYTYYDAKIFIPLMLVFLIIYYRDKFLNDKKKLFINCFIFLLLILPLLNLMLSRKDVWTRPQNTVIFSDIGSVLDINQEIGDNRITSPLNPRIFHNKLIKFAEVFISNYLKHFDSDFLYFKGDYIKIYSTVNIGIMYLMELPFFLLGFLYLAKYTKSEKYLLFFWLLMAPIAASLTKFVPSASRTMLLVVPLAVIPSYGIYYCSILFKKFLKNTFILFTVILFTINIAYYLHFYYFITPLRYSREWHYGMKQVIQEVQQVQNRYDSIWFSKKAWGYIYPLFFIKYPPSSYQPQALLSSPDEFGFGWIENFDKYLFGKIPKYFDLNKNILYVVAEGDLPFRTKPLYEINYPDGQLAFQLVDTKTLQRDCYNCSLIYKPEDEDIFGNKLPAR